MITMEVFAHEAVAAGACCDSDARSICGHRHSPIFKPDYFIKRSGIRRGGEMLTESNRAGFQIAGAIFAAVAIYLLYTFFRH